MSHKYMDGPLGSQKNMSSLWLHKTYFCLIIFLKFLGDFSSLQWLVTYCGLFYDLENPVVSTTRKCGSPR